MNILNLNWHRKYANFENAKGCKADIIILDSFQNAKEISEIVRNEKIFDNVYLINRYRNEGLLHKVSTFFDIVFPSRYLKKTGSIKRKEMLNKYDYLVVPKVSRVTLSIWLLNKKAKIQLIEDGLGTYCGGQNMCYEGHTYQGIYKFLNHGQEFSQYVGIYLNDKDIYMDYDKNKTIEIPKFNFDYLNVIKNKFKKFLFDNKEKHIFWLGQYLPGTVNEITNEVLTKYKDEVIFCPHPRFSNIKNDTFEELKGNRMWELNLLNLEDLENRCFISITSTAMFSAKFLYDYEPYIISTIKLFDYGNDEHFRLSEEAIYKIKESYRKPEKVMIPETQEELDNYIKYYLNKINNHNYD